jgi:hypothetical protein
MTTTSKLLNTIDEVLELAELDPRELVIFLDTEELERHPETQVSVPNLLATAKQSFRMLQQYSFRDVVFCGSSIPEKVGPRYNVEPLRKERAELSVWKELVSDASLPLIGFGDYAVVPAFESDPDKPVRPPSRIRLSTDTHHVLYRGPRENHRHLCSRVMENHPEYLLTPSWGGSETRACARGFGGVGAPSDWIARDTNAHLEGTVQLVEQHLKTLQRIDNVDLDEIEQEPWLQDILQLS